MQTLRQIWFKLVTAAIVVVMIGILAYQAMPHSSKNPNLGVKKQATDFELNDLSGKPVRLSDSNGKVRLLYFFYSNCPDVCSPTTFVMSGVQDLLKEKGIFGSKTELLSVTIDPEHDTPEALTKFSNLFHADFSGWSFLRGSVAYTDELTQKYDIASIKEQDGTFTHSNVIFLLDGKGNIRYYYNGSDVELTKAKIVSDMLQLMHE